MGMNLVFFDIECASVNKTTAKICAFGYVVCDENFNIIKKEDILVNPKEFQYQEMLLIVRILVRQK